MKCRALSLALLCLACVCAAPVPGKVTVTLIRDSILGYDLQAGDQKASGVLDGTRTVDVDLPDEAAQKAPKITLLENVESGAGIAFGENIDIDAIKKKVLATKIKFWRKK